MNNLPRQKLCDLITRYGQVLCDEPSRCEGLLRDLCAQNRREVNVLMTALKERIATDLLSSSTSSPIELLLSRLIKRLQDHHGMTDETARWAVESWALALGRISVSELSKPTTPTRSLPTPEVLMTQPVSTGSQPITHLHDHQGLTDETVRRATEKYQLLASLTYESFCEAYSGEIPLCYYNRKQRRNMYLAWRKQILESLGITDD